MKKETMLKTILVLMMSVVLLAMPVSVLAATSNSALEDFWEDQGGLNEIQPEQQPQTQPEPEKQPESQPQPEKQPEQQKPNTDIPKAGLVEDTMIVVAITILGIATVYAYKKVNEYKNI